MAVTYTFWRSTVPASRFPVPIATGLASPTFTDTAGLAGVRYYYTMTKVDSGVSTQSNEASAVFPALAATTYAKDTMSTRIFSTGTLFIDTGAGPLEFAILQEIEWQMPFQEKELRAAPWINMFAEARAFYGGKMTLKAKNATILAAGLAAATGGTNTLPVAADADAMPPVIAAPGVMSVGKTAILPHFAAVFTTQDENGDVITLTCQNVRTPGLTLPLKLDDYAMPDVQMIADKDENGVVGVWLFAV